VPSIQPYLQYRTYENRNKDSFRPLKKTKTAAAAAKPPGGYDSSRISRVVWQLTGRESVESSQLASPPRQPPLSGSGCVHRQLFWGSVFGLFVFLPSATLQGFPQADGPFLDFLSVLGKSGLRGFPQAALCDVKKQTSSLVNYCINMYIPYPRKGSRRIPLGVRADSLKVQTGLQLYQLC